MYLLAQSTVSNDQEPAKSSVFDVVTNIFANGDALANPDQLVEALQRMSVVWAVIFFISGLLCLFNGYRFYKVATVLLALFIGVFLGYALGKRIGAQWIVAGCTGALLATVCFPLMKFAVAALGGVTGAYVGANTWSAVAQITANPESTAAENYWIGAIIGLILCGMLAFILFKLSIIFFTSISGSTIAVLGFIALLLQFPIFQENVASSLKAHASIIPLLVLVPALIGLILQETNPNNRPVETES